MILNKKEILLFDSSNYFYDDKNNTLKQEIFGNLNIIQLNNESIQINGTCTYWTDCIHKVILTDERYRVILT